MKRMLSSQAQRIFLAFFIIAGLSGVVPALAAPRFVSATEDLPLMPGLEEAPGSVMVFDAPSGRVVEVLATGALSRDEVIAFYSATLPQLGWRQEEKALFFREGEILRLEFPDSVPGLLTVRFYLAPAAAGNNNAAAGEKNK